MSFRRRSFIGTMDQIATPESVNRGSLDRFSPDYPDVNSWTVPEALAWREPHQVDEAVGHGDGMYRADRMFYAGYSNHGYHVFGYEHEDGTVRVGAGCRWFTLPEAKVHWHPDYEPNHGMCRLIGLIEHWATDGAVAAPRALTPPRVPVAVVQEFLGPVLYSQFRNWVLYRKQTPTNSWPEVDPAVRPFA